MSDYTTVQEVKRMDANSAASFRCLLILHKKASKVAKNGNPFLNIELGDRTGRFNANIFSDSEVFHTLDDTEEGAIMRVAGKTEYYQERFSPRIHAVEPIDMEEAEGMLEHLVEVPPEPDGELWSFIQEAVEAIGHKAIQETVQRVLDEMEGAFRVRAAAVSMHHAYRHGLLEHTAHMVRVCRALLPIYKEVDSDLAIAGTILHDIGKLEEYEGDFTTKVSRIGTLQGHVVLGFRIVRKAALQSKLNEDLTERLEHIILSHQGEKAWGAAAMAATPEAVFVSMIDNLDAKMGVVQHALRSTKEPDEFSDYSAALQARVLVAKPDKT